MSYRPAYFHCALCGFEFEKLGAASCATTCVLARHCKLVRCPNCGYEFPEPSQAPGWLRKLFGRATAAPARNRELFSLDEASEGATYELVCLNGSHASRRTALAVYGLVPGCRLSVARKRPSFVVRVGETELAFEGSIAREIFVRRAQG
jgi:Fe2+ transport system protein FeoA/rubredoxin